MKRYFFCEGSGDCQLHLSSHGYNAVVHTLCQTATASDPPIGWVGVTVCPLLLKEYLDAKRVSSSGSGDVDRFLAVSLIRSNFLFLKNKCVQ